MNQPPELNTEAWNNYLQDRKKRGIKKWTDSGEQAAIKKLLSISTDHEEQVLILENCMATGHQGFFPKPLEGQQKQIFQQSRKQATAEKAELFCCQNTQDLVDKYGKDKRQIKPIGPEKVRW